MHRNRFRVGTFNLCNLVLPDVLYYRKKIYTQKEYALKTTWIAEQLKKMKADIVGFQEVFHQEALQQALAQSQVYDDATTVFANPTGKSPVVALTSRFPVLEYNVIKDFPTTACLDIEGTDIPLKRFSRPVLEAHLKLSDTIDCTVFVIHLKSKRPIIPDGVDRNDPIEQAKGQARSLILRAAEATALRVILMDKLQHRDHPVIVMGDINDSGLAITSQIVSGEPPLRKLWFQKKQMIWDVLLYYVKDIQARQNYGDFYYTHIHNGHHDSLDHILVSQEFVVQNPKRIGRVGYVSLFNDHLIDETLSDEKIETWQSDHGQVVVSIELD